MARHGHVYPQVEPRAADLMDRRVATVPASASVRKALDVARAGSRPRGDGSPRGGAAGGPRARGGVGIRETALARHRPCRPALGDGRNRRDRREAAASGRRRRGARARRPAGRGHRRAVAPSGGVGHVDPSRGSSGSRAPRERRGSGCCAPRASSREAQGQAVFAVGGFVRDLLLVRASSHVPDLDLVVEGDGIAFGRRLAEETGGHLVVHAAFGTASLEGGDDPRWHSNRARGYRLGAPRALWHAGRPAGGEPGFDRRGPWTARLLGQCHVRRSGAIRVGPAARPLRRPARPGREAPPGPAPAVVRRGSDADLEGRAGMRRGSGSNRTRASAGARAGVEGGRVSGPLRDSVSTRSWTWSWTSRTLGACSACCSAGEP